MPSGVMRKHPLFQVSKLIRVKIMIYSLTGMLAALAGAILTSRLNSAQPTAGTSYELDAIAAVVLGGTSLLEDADASLVH